MQAVSVWLLVAFSASSAPSFPPVVERFVTQRDCEAVKVAMTVQIEDNLNGGSRAKEYRANPNLLRCIPATVAR